MLREAKAAGEELLWVKKCLKHGEFKPWIKENCRFSYDTAVQYMRVVKIIERENVEVHTFEGGIRTLLDAYTSRRSPKASLPPFSQTDAEYAQKLHTMSLRGTEHEREVAKDKLEAFAKSFGKTSGSFIR